MRKKLGGLVIFSAIVGLGSYLYNTYGTLEPCGLLRAEVKMRLMDGRIDTLGEIPVLMVNAGDQIWCAKEFILTYLP